MNDVDVASFLTESPEESEALAGQLAAVLEPGDVLFLDGSLGAGKTTFTRGLLRGLFHPDPREVASPTFALHHRYLGGRLDVDHLDLYRLEPDRDALARQGILDPFEQPRGIVVVEWGDRWIPRPTGRWTVDFEVLGEERRRITLRGSGAKDIRPTS